MSHVGVMLIRGYFAVSIPKNCIEARMGPEIYFFVIIYKVTIPSKIESFCFCYYSLGRDMDY